MTLALPQKLSPTAIFCTFHHHMDWSTTCILKHSTLHNFPSCHSNTPPPTSLDPAVFDSFKPSAILVLSPSPPAGVHCIWLQLHLQQVKWIWLVYTATPRPPPMNSNTGCRVPLWSLEWGLTALLTRGLKPLRANPGNPLCLSAFY